MSSEEESNGNSTQEETEPTFGGKLLEDQEFSDINFKICHHNSQTKEVFAHKAALAITGSKLREQFRGWQQHSLSDIIRRANEGALNPKENNINNEETMSTLEKKRGTSPSKLSEQLSCQSDSSSTSNVKTNTLYMPMQSIYLNNIDLDSFKVFLKYCYTFKLSKKELETYEEQLYSLGEKLGGDRIFKALDTIEVKLPIRKSNSLKALLATKVDKEVRRKARKFFTEKANEILSKLNLRSNKKRIKKNIDKFEELLKEPDLNGDESTILELILDLPEILEITEKKESKELVVKMLEHVQLKRVGYKALIRAYISNHVPSEIISKYTMEGLKRSAIGGDSYGLHGLPRATFTSANDYIERIRHSTDSFELAKFDNKDPETFNFDSGVIGKMIVFKFKKPLRICKLKMSSQDYANIMFSIQASKDGNNFSTIGLMRHIKGHGELEWNPIYNYQWWKISVKEHNGNKGWFSYAEWFIRKCDSTDESIDDTVEEDDIDENDIDELDSKDDDLENAVESQKVSSSEEESE